MNTESPVFCSYRNCTDKIVILRARSHSTNYLERVVFPFELLTFHCPRDCEVEVIMRTPSGLEDSEWVAAEELIAGEQLQDRSTIGEELLAQNC